MHHARITYSHEGTEQWRITYVVLGCLRRQPAVPSGHREPSPRALSAPETGHILGQFAVLWSEGEENALARTWPEGEQ